jgi:hypothetical protein
MAIAGRLVSLRIDFEDEVSKAIFKDCIYSSKFSGEKISETGLLERLYATIMPTNTAPLWGEAGAMTRS